MNTEGREEYVVARQPSRQRQNEQVSHRREQGDSTSPLLRNKESPIGAQFERLRRSAIFDLKDFIRFQGPNRAEHRYPDRNHQPGAIITADGSDTENTPFEVARDCLRAELRLMLSLLQRIQEAEWSYKLFPYVPQCLLYVCGFALAQELARTPDEGVGVPVSTGNPYTGLKGPTSTIQRRELSGQSHQRQPTNSISEIVWRTTENAAMLSARVNIIRGILLLGLGSSGIWTVYRSLRFGIIVWCKHSLKRLIMAVERNDLEEGAQNSLSGLGWSLLWWINIMF